ncbi:MAG TPA: response regulator [Candidatus Sulfopaludibacter sp.]|nr:response regulator [Candidatus Sulfopaludibacter sp.]
MGTANSTPKEGTILVVEDADAIRKLVCSMLSLNGYQCLEASDGAEALQVVEKVNELHLVLTDVMMPHMGGPELARHLAILRPEVRIIFMSGYTEDPMVRHVERLPGVFLPKPFTAAALTTKVRQALEQPWKGLPGVG